MSEMVNRVRDVIANAQARGFNGPEALARLAISVMREPTEAMARVGFETWQTTGARSDTSQGVDIWRAMVDAALRETT